MKTIMILIVILAVWFAPPIPPEPSHAVRLIPPAVFVGWRVFAPLVAR